MNILVTVPEPLCSRILTQEARALLLDKANVTWNEDGRNWIGPELAARLAGVDGLLTGWGITSLTAEVLAGADRLGIIGHSAGSVKGFITPAVYDKGIVVTHAACRIADSVAEFTLTMALLGLKRPDLFSTQMHQGLLWEQNPSITLHEIAGMQVGILGCGYVGQRAIKLFRAVGALVWVYDPYLSLSRAQELGVVKAGLNDILRSCPVISVHLPSTDETYHMLGAAEFSLIRDGAVFINTSRSWVLDELALATELAKGRFWAALDVFDQEPLPTDHPLRRMDNVLLTPHIAGRTQESYQNLLGTVIDELLRFFAGQPLRYQVTRDMLATMA
ncbi:MAG: hydroxyacid dehydrogenase [Anaerolineae bacterium]